jgi:hypothetical protein
VTLPPFDGNDYRKRVLAPLVDDPDAAADDPFALVDLPPDVDDDGAIRARIDEVVAFWQKEQTRPKYRGLVTGLLGRREALRAELTDPTRRAAARGRVVAGRAAADAERFARLDDLVARLVARHGGVPRSKRAQLAEVARRDGVTDAELAARLDRHADVDDTSDDAVASLAAPVRRQIRSGLDELARLRDDRPGTRTLYAFLGVGPGDPVDVLRTRHGEVGARNRQRRADRERTVVDDLLALAQQHLIEGDRRRYDRALVDDFRDAIRDDVHGAVVVDDRLSAAETERLVRDGVAAGLDPEQARSAVQTTAREVGGSVELGAVVDYVVCPSCGRAEADDGRTTTCRHCGTALYVPCPRCGTSIGALAARCGNCGLDVAAHRREQAAARWSEVARAVAAHRLVAAREGLVALAHDAPDLVGPDGRLAAQWLVEVGPTLDAADRDVVAASRLPLAEREAALGGVLERVADHRRAREELATLPPAAPSNVEAVVDGDEVTVRWTPSPSRGEVTYRVVRSVQVGDNPVREQGVGSTSGRELGDGGVPVGAVTEYAVVALRGGRASEAARSRPVVVLGDVEHLVAFAREGEVELRWRFTGDPGDVWVERRVADDASAPTRRFRPGDGTLVDRDLTPGTRYRYRVYAELRDGAGGTVRTDGLTAEATAVVAPVPVLDLAATVDRGGVALRWTPPPHGEVTIVRAATNPGVATGARVDARALSRLGAALPSSPGRAFDGGAPGPRHYLPVSVDGDVGVAGRTLLHLGVGDITALRAVDWGTAIALTWNWPDGVTEALVVWRRDRPPDGPDDPRAETRKVTNVVYGRDGGIALGGDGQQPFHITVHAGTNVGGTRLWAPAGPEARIQVRGPRTEFVSYDVKRTGMRGRGVRVDLDAQVALPELVLVATAGEQPPVYPVHGQELARIPAGATRVRQEVDASQLPVPVAVRLFVADAAAHPDVILRDPPPDRLVVR